MSAIDFILFAQETRASIEVFVDFSLKKTRGAAQSLAPGMDRSCQVLSLK